MLDKHKQYVQMRKGMQLSKVGPSSSMKLDCTCSPLVGKDYPSF